MFKIQDNQTHSPCVAFENEAKELWVNFLEKFDGNIQNFEALLINYN
jgi:hypothetical protein